MHLLTVEDVAQMLDCSEQRVYRLTRAGVLPVIHLGRQLRFDPERLKQWLDEGGSTATVPVYREAR